MNKKSEKVKVKIKSKNKEAEDIESDEDKYNRLISEIRPNILSHSKIKSGGGDVRRLHAHEMSAYNGVLSEINEIGKRIGKPPIGLGHIRKN